VSASVREDAAAERTGLRGGAREPVQEAAVAEGVAAGEQGDVLVVEVADFAYGVDLWLEFVGGGGLGEGCGCGWSWRGVWVWLPPLNWPDMEIVLDNRNW
jgi:hypothetical protein